MSDNGKVLRGGTGPSNASADLISPEIIDRAKIQGAKPPQAKASPEAEKKKETIVTTAAPPANPLMAKLAEAMKRASEKAQEVRTKETQSAEIARATASNEEMVRSFLTMIQQVQELVVVKITSAGKTEQSARKQVSQLGASDQVKLLADYASDDDVQDILASLEVINSEPRTRDALYGAIDWWYRPLVEIGTMEALDKFLSDAFKAGVVSLAYGKKPSDQAVTIKVFGQNDKYYLPKPERDEAVAGWTFCKEAEEWAIKNLDAMSRLRQQATQELTPFLISKRGYQGNLFVPLSLHEAVLLEVKVQGGWTTVRCIDSVGLQGKDIPDGGQYQWDNHRKTVVGNSMSDVWQRISDTVNQMAQDQYDASHQRLNVKEARTKPLLEGTTVGSHFKDQGLTRVLQKDQTAVVAMWRFDHSWNNRDGFLGFKVRWQGGILVEAVDYDHFFPKQLIGTVMPVTIANETLRVRLDSLPRNTDKQKDEYSAWKMLEVFLNARLTQENRNVGTGDQAAKL